MNDEAKTSAQSEADGRVGWYENSKISLFDKTGQVIGVLGVSGDITERKRAEDALRESEAKYRFLVDNAYDLIWTLTADGVFTYVSPSWQRTLGYEPSYMIGKLFQPFVHPDDVAICEGYLHKVIQAGERMPGPEYRVKHIDGTWRWHTASGTPVFSIEGAFISFIGVSRDITERKRAEEILRKSEKRFRELAELLPETVYETDIQGRLTFVNKNAFDRFGYTQEDFDGGLNALNMVTPDDRDRAMENIQRIMNGENIGSDEFTLRRKDGSTFPSMIHSTAIIHDSKSVGLRGFIVDITSRKRAEESLRATEAKYRSLASSVDSMYLVDRNCRYLFMNEVCRLRFDVPLEDIIGKRYDDFHSDENSKEFAKTVKEVFETGKPIHLEHQSERDQCYFIRTFSPVMDQEGKSIFAVTISSKNITDRRQIEEERKVLQERLNRAEKMEALGTLAGGVAHDLNNVLGIVVGYAEMLLMDVDSRSIRPQLVSIMTGGQRAAAIVDDLLTLARRGVPNRQILNLNKIIADCQQSPEFEKLYSYHPAVKIKTDLEPDLLNISGSSVHLGKTLFNLISNANEAMQKGGTVTIKTTNQYLDKPIQGYDEVREGDYVVLSVSDTGEGIPAADLKRIFEPFYTKKVMGRSGTGLGLAVVWGTVKDHHGYINVESEEGKGSTFTLYFPVTREDITAESVTIAISEYMGQGESILVVDDIKEQRDLAAGMLGKLNYSVTCVSGGEEAIDYLKEHKADLMVLDMIMDPGKDGLDTYRSVLEIHPQQKAIIVSGFSETDRVKAAQAFGAGAYVRKPYVIEKLGLAVRNELDRADHDVSASL
jgi:PAS domain S-box-containing protein